MLAKEAGCVASEKCAMKKKIASFQSGNATCWQRELEAESKGKKYDGKKYLAHFWSVNGRKLLFSRHLLFVFGKKNVAS